MFETSRDRQLSSSQCTFPSLRHERSSNSFRSHESMRARGALRDTSLSSVLLAGITELPLRGDASPTLRGSLSSMR